MTIKNGDLPAMPAKMQYPLEFVGSGEIQMVDHVSVGLTKREELAARFMAAWIIHHGTSGEYGYNSHQAANDAIRDADILLSELERTI